MSVIRPAVTFDLWHTLVYLEPEAEEAYIDYQIDTAVSVLEGSDPLPGRSQGGGTRATDRIRTGIPRGGSRVGGGSHRFPYRTVRARGAGLGPPAADRSLPRCPRGGGRRYSVPGRSRSPPRVGGTARARVRGWGHLQHGRRARPILASDAASYRVRSVRGNVHVQRRNTPGPSRRPRSSGPRWHCWVRNRGPRSTSGTDGPTSKGGGERGWWAQYCSLAS